MSRSKSQHEAERWWLTAQEDLDVAKTLHEAGKFSHACFLSQQSAEKAMKALWLAIDADPWGHSIQKLVMQFPRQKMLQDIEKWLANAAYLDKFYIPTRYPNGLPDLTPGQVYISEDSMQAVERASFFLDGTRKLIKGL
jgi:HEPN domain-containing protein